MPSPANWKIARLDARELASLRDMEARIKAARQRVAMIVHAAARDRKLVVSGRNREKLYKQIGAVYLQLDNGLKDWGKDITRKGAIDWHDAAIRDIKGQTGTDPSNNVTKFSREYAEDLFKRIHPENDRSLAAVLTDNMAQKDIKALRESTVDVYRESALSGMTLQDIQKGIQERWDKIAGDQAAFRFVDGAGRPWENARYLQMLVRTTTARVARDSYFDTLTKNGDDLAIVQNADGEACDICMAWDGVIISISGASESYPSYQQALDAGCFHPNCRCMAERVDETIDKAAIQQQAETPTPDFTRRDDETDAQYRNRMTDAVAGYSEEFSVEGSGKLTPAPQPQDQSAKVRNELIAQSKAEGFSLEQEIKKTPDSVFGKMSSMPKMVRENSNCAHYVAADHSIHMPTDQKSWSGNPLVFHHELAHSIHTQTGVISSTGQIEATLEKAMTTDFSAWKKAAKAEYGESWKSVFSSHSGIDVHIQKNGLGKSYSTLPDEKRHRVSMFWDTLGGMSKGNYGGGHTKGYYRHMNGVHGKKEVYANVYSAIVNGWGEFDKTFPLTAKWIRSNLGI